MTPKEKAIELFDKFRVKVHDRNGTSAMNGFEAKQCALIAIDEIFQSLGHKKLSDSPYTTLEARQYYVEVKQEIENL